MLNFSRYRIIAVGKIRKEWIKNGIALYLKRLPKLTIIELKDSNPQRETEAILSALKTDEKMVVLTEEVESLPSFSFARQLKDFQFQRLALVNGGADGLTPKIKNFAHYKLSLSSLTFPHEIARLLLLEQLYRAQTILQNSPYHRNSLHTIPSPPRRPDNPPSVTHLRA